MYLISGNIGKHFGVSSRSPGRTLLITPLKSYRVDKNAYDWPKDVILTLGGFHYDMWHGFGLQGEMDLGLEVNKNGLIYL
ncbi:hypothetical protein H5410_051006 [Solanum commersonii]|uniref:Uncharacterized protein n=1 Tax=Solanum commersonii TaxID=4109 RepID=A0A9J5WX54_SOLCO|nr:hypothetical protein H5410_051006 [Solanum commersonii]